MNRQEGFTLIEVMVAALVLVLGLGIVLSATKESLIRLADSNREIAATRLGEERIREIQADVPSDELLEVGTTEGHFEGEDEEFRWVLHVESYSIELAEQPDKSPEELEALRATSTIFALETPADPDALEPSIRRVTLHVLAEDEEEEDVLPFVIFLVEPPNPEALPESEGREEPEEEEAR